MISSGHIEENIKYNINNLNTKNNGTTKSKQVLPNE